MAIDLTETASNGRWVTGQLVGSHNTRNTEEIPWDGSSGDSRGFAKAGRKTLENGETREVLRTHPKWVDRGTIKGFLPWETISDYSVFTADVGFLDGAGASDGVTFWVFEHHIEDGREVWHPIARRDANYDGELQSIKADLSHLAGKDVRIELRVDSDGTSTQDWAVWADPTIEPLLGTDDLYDAGSMPVTMDLQRYHCLDPDELDTLFAPDGDEPYLLTLGVIVDGRSLPVKTAVLDGNTAAAESRLSWGVNRGKPGNLDVGDADAGESFPVPDRTGRFEETLHLVVPPIDPDDFGTVNPATGTIAHVGLVVVAMEHDSLSDEAIKSGYETLRTELKSKLDSLIQSKVEQIDPDNVSSGSDGVSFDASEIGDLQDGIESEVRETIKSVTKDRFDLFGMINPDETVGSAHRLWSYEELQGQEHSFTMSFETDTIHYEIDGEVKNG